MADNFRRAAAAVRKSMDDGRTSTREGLRAIRDYMVSALDLYGVDIHQARALVRNRTTPGRGNVNQFGQNEGGGGSGDQTGNQRGGMVRRFMSGGWLVGRGLVGSDTVQVGPNAWAAPGEYQALGPGNMAGIFTRHQQREMSPFLAQGGYTWDTLPRDQRALPLLEALTSQIGGLATVFSMIDRPHMFQGGGIVPVPGFPGERANQSVVPEIEAIAHRFHLVLTDAYGPGHQSPGHTVTGTAADFAGSDRAMDAAVRYLVSRGYLVGYDGRFGSQQWPGHGPSYVAGSNAHLHVELGTRGGQPIQGAAAARRTCRVCGSAVAGWRVASRTLPCRWSAERRSRPLTRRRRARPRPRFRVGGPPIVVCSSGSVGRSPR
jgi:hypothetical protein